MVLEKIIKKGSFTSKEDVFISMIREMIYDKNFTIDLKRDVNRFDFF
jgi:hypothetical protein